MAAFLWALERRAEPSKPWRVAATDVEDFPLTDPAIFGEQKRIELTETEGVDFTDPNIRLTVATY